MQSIHREDVPEYLRKGDWFQVLDPDDDESFEVPADCLKLDENVTTKEDLLFLLRSLQFWQVRNISAEAVDFILRHDEFDVCAEFPVFSLTIQHLKVVKRSDPTKRIPAALILKLGIKLTRWFIENASCDLSASTCAFAAQLDDLEALAYLHEKGCSWDANTIKAALVGGSIECLKYAQARGCPALPADENPVNVAARRGHIHMIKHLLNSGEEWGQDTMSYAVTGGSVECMKYLFESGCEWGADVCAQAIIYDKRECLQFAHEHGCPWSEETITVAAECGNLACLQYAHENGCPWDATVTYFAARENRLDCLRYAHEHGCPWHTNTTCAALIRGQWWCLLYAARNGAEYFYAVAIVVYSFILPSLYAAFLYELWNYDPTKRLSVISRAACCFSLPNILIHILVDMMGVEFAYYMSVPNQRRLKFVGQGGVIIGMTALVFGVFVMWVYPEGNKGGVEA